MWTVSGIHVFCVYQTWVSFFLPACWRTLRLHQWPPNCHVNIYLALFWCLCKRLTVIQCTLGLLILLLVRFSYFTERTLVCAAPVYLQFGKRDWTSGQVKTVFRLDSRNRNLGFFFNIVFKCTGRYCYYICIHCILIFLLDFCLLYQIWFLIAVVIKNALIQEKQINKDVEKRFKFFQIFY